MNIHCREFEFNLRDWAYWPGREDLSIEFMRLLGAAQEGGIDDRRVLRDREPD